MISFCMNKWKPSEANNLLKSFLNLSLIELQLGQSVLTNLIGTDKAIFVTYCNKI